MTPHEHSTYLKLAFQAVGLGFNNEQIETIIMTTKAVNKKKGNFTLMDAAKIRAEINTKFPPIKEPELFDELEEILNESQPS